MSIRLIATDGTETDYSAAHDGPAPLEWCYEHAGIEPGYIELVRVLDPDALREGKRVAAQMLVHEEGRLRALAFNEKATRIYWANPISQGVPITQLEDSPIVGPALLLTGKHQWRDESDEWRGDD